MRSYKDQYNLVTKFRTKRKVSAAYHVLRSGRVILETTELNLGLRSIYVQFI